MKKEREKRIELIKDWAAIYYYGMYKTVILHEVPLYSVVTRVNYMTASMWLKWRNTKVNDRRKGFVELPDKPNWLVMNRNFRRMQERKIKVLEYLKQREQRKNVHK